MFHLTSKPKSHGAQAIVVRVHGASDFFVLEICVFAWARAAVNPCVQQSSGGRGNNDVTRFRVACLCDSNLSMMRLRPCKLPVAPIPARPKANSVACVRKRLRWSRIQRRHESPPQFGSRSGSYVVFQARRAEFKHCLQCCATARLAGTALVDVRTFCLPSANSSSLAA